MKILQIIDSLPATSGGARFVVNLAIEVAKRNIFVDVLVIDGRYSHFLEELKNTGINLIILDKNTTNRYKPRYVRQIASIIDNYDLVHVHVFPASYFVALASILNKGKTLIVFTEHAAFNRRATNPYFKFIEKFIYERFVKVVAISEAVQVFVHKNLGVKDEKISVINNGVNTNKIFKSVAADRAKFNISAADKVVLMAARFADEKDHATVIKSFINLPENFKLIFAGDGPNLDRCQKQVEELGLLPKVQFLGSRADIYQIIKMSDINVLSSHHEGFGLSAVEAMAAGKPTIATNVPGLSEVVDKAGILFNLGDHAQLTSLILKLGTDDEFYKEISKRCLDRSKIYNIESMVDRYIALYQDVIKQKNGR